MTSTFGQQQPAANSLFGQKPFGTPATSANTFAGGFGTAPAASAAATPFGAAKPFGQQPTTGLFGQTPASTGNYIKKIMTLYSFYEYYLFVIFNSISIWSNNGRFWRLWSSSTCRNKSTELIWYYS